jgi:hypothetical protein
MSSKQYESLLNTRDKKLPEYYQSVINSGTLGVIPNGEYENGQIGRACTVPTFSQDRLELNAQNPATVAHRVRIIKGVPSNFWSIPQPFPAPFARVPMNPVAIQSSPSYVSTTPIQKATNTILHKEKSDNSNLKDGRYEVNKIIQHIKAKSSYKFKVELKLKNGELVTTLEPYSHLRKCNKLFHYVSSCDDELLKRF